MTCSAIDCLIAVYVSIIQTFYLSVKLFVAYSTYSCARGVKDVATAVNAGYSGAVGCEYITITNTILGSTIRVADECSWA